MNIISEKVIRSIVDVEGYITANSLAELTGISASLLAKEVDFFSIGTNDLTQYTLAIDRQNQKLDNIYDSHHPAIMRMIQMVVNNAHQENCWVGICGELGADTSLTQRFVEMGVDELSVSPTFILPIRKLIRELP